MSSTAPAVVMGGHRPLCELLYAYMGFGIACHRDGGVKVIPGEYGDDDNAVLWIFSVFVFRRVSDIGSDTRTDLRFQSGLAFRAGPAAFPDVVFSEPIRGIRRFFLLYL